jgi:hypothetical protein
MNLSPSRESAIFLYTCQPDASAPFRVSGAERPRRHRQAYQPEISRIWGCCIKARGMLHQGSRYAYRETETPSGQLKRKGVSKTQSCYQHKAAPYPQPPSMGPFTSAPPLHPSLGCCHTLGPLPTGLPGLTGDTLPWPDTASPAHLRTPHTESASCRSLCGPERGDGGQRWTGLKGAPADARRRCCVIQQRGDLGECAAALLSPLKHRQMGKPFHQFSSPLQRGARGECRM